MFLKDKVKLKKTFLAEVNKCLEVMGNIARNTFDEKDLEYITKSAPKWEGQGHLHTAYFPRLKEIKEILELDKNKYKEEYINGLLLKVLGEFFIARTCKEMDSQRETIYNSEHFRRLALLKGA